MTAVHPKTNGQVRIDIVEKQKKPTSTQPKKSSKSKSIETSKQSSCKKLFGILLFVICLYIITCEIISFGLKTINTLPKDTILYQCRILVSCIVLGCLIIGWVYFLISFMNWTQSTDTMIVLDDILYYCTRNTTSSMRWYQQKQFARTLLVIGLGLLWFVMFELGYLLYVTIDSIKDKPAWSRFTVYGFGGVPLFMFCLMVLCFYSIVMLGVCFEEAENDAERSSSTKHTK